MPHKALTLSRKVDECKPLLVGLFKQWGNARSNRLWEGGLATTSGVEGGAGGGTGGGQEGVEGNGEGGAGGAVHGNVGFKGGVEGGEGGGGAKRKPKATDSLEVKSGYIRAKYVGRVLMAAAPDDVVSGEHWQGELCAAVVEGDVARGRGLHSSTSHLNLSRF